MKNIYFLFLTILISGASFGQVLASDDFSYANGPLVPNGGWTNHSGTEGDCAGIFDSPKYMPAFGSGD